MLRMQPPLFGGVINIKLHCKSVTWGCQGAASRQPGWGMRASLCRWRVSPSLQTLSSQSAAALCNGWGPGGPASWSAHDTPAPAACMQMWILCTCCMRRRVVPAPKLDASVLPMLDFVCISHNHFDHLDLGTITQLHAIYGSSVTWCAPLFVAMHPSVNALPCSICMRSGLPLLSGTCLCGSGGGSSVRASPTWWRWTGGRVCSTQRAASASS